MTKKIFWQNPYLTELDVIVKTVDGTQITVDKTIFYALSGGQESDHGTIGSFEVFEAKKEGKEIFYRLEEGHTLKPGDKLKMVIDWDRRYKLMRLHFAAELVLELVCKKFPEIIKVGAHIAQDKARIDFEKARIDFEWEQSISTYIASLQNDAQSIINSNQEIISAFSDEIAERRYWKINEFSEVPCGGTHIRRTGEIRTIRLKRANPGKGKERIEIYA